MEPLPPTGERAHGHLQIGRHLRGGPACGMRGFTEVDEPLPRRGFACAAHILATRTGSAPRAVGDPGQHTRGGLRSSHRHDRHAALMPRAAIEDVEQTILFSRRRYRCRPLWTARCAGLRSACIGVTLRARRYRGQDHHGLFFFRRARSRWRRRCLSAIVFFTTSSASGAASTWATSSRTSAV